MEEVEVAVPFMVLLAVMEEGRPLRMSWEFEELVEPEEVPVAVEFDIDIMLVPTANMVVEPKVDVRVEDPLVIVETRADVVIAEVDGRVYVDEYEM